MIRKRKLVLAAALVAVAALVLAGTSYARSLASQEPRVADLVAGCGDVATGDMHSTMWASLAQSLGLTPEQLDRALAEGKSLESLAGEKGISNEKLAEKMLAAMKAALDQQVAQGKLSSEQAKALLDGAKSHMTPEHIVSMGSTAGSMHGGTGAWQDMDAMHQSMHGSDEAFGAPCHGDETGGSMMGGGTGSPGRSMMGQQF